MTRNIATDNSFLSRNQLSPTSDAHGIDESSTLPVTRLPWLPLPKIEAEEPASLPCASNSYSAPNRLEGATSEDGQRQSSLAKNVAGSRGWIAQLRRALSLLAKPFTMPGEDYIPSSLEIFSYDEYLRTGRCVRFLPPAVEIFLGLGKRLAVWIVVLCGVLKLGEIIR